MTKKNINTIQGLRSPYRHLSRPNRIPAIFWFWDFKVPSVNKGLKTHHYLADCLKNTKTHKSQDSRVTRYKQLCLQYSSGKVFTAKFT